MHNANRREAEASDASFRECLIAVHINNTSNMATHLALHHAKWVQENNPSEAKSKPQIVLKAKQTGSQECMAMFMAKGNNVMLERVHILAARLVVIKFLPSTVPRADEFTTLLDAATYLKPRTYKAITNGKLNKCLVLMFSEFVKFTSSPIASTRALFTPDNYDEMVDEALPGWLIVCHDGWDSAIRQLFGVSVYWINPFTFRCYKVALDLDVPNGHLAIECDEAAMTVLSRFGILKSDLFVSVNGTTNASVATGCLLANEACTLPTLLPIMPLASASGRETWL
jgi:hypothetical protein